MGNQFNSDRKFNRFEITMKTCNKYITLLSERLSYSVLGIFIKIFYGVFFYQGLFKDVSKNKIVALFFVNILCSGEREERQKE